MFCQVKWLTTHGPVATCLLLVLKTPMYCLICYILECFEPKSSLFHITHILMKRTWIWRICTFMWWKGHSWPVRQQYIPIINYADARSARTRVFRPKRWRDIGDGNIHVCSQNRWCDIVANNYMNTIIKLINRYSQRTKLSGGVERTWCKYILSHYSDLTKSLYITH